MEPHTSVANVPEPELGEHLFNFLPWDLLVFDKQSPLWHLLTPIVF